MTGTSTPVADTTNPNSDGNDQPTEDQVTEPAEQEKTQEEIWKEFEDADAGLPVDDPDPHEAGAGEDTEDSNIPEDPDPSPPADESADADTPPTQPTDEQQDAPDPETVRLQEENARLRKTISGQGRKIQSLLSKRERAQEKLDAGKQSSEEADAQASALEASKEEYGDIISPVADAVTALKGKVDTLSKDSQEEIDEIDQEIRDIVLEQGQILMADHPDFNDVLKNNRSTFDAWIEDQPKLIRDAHAVNGDHIVDGAAASRVMTEFKKALAAADGQGDTPETKKTDDAKRERQLAGAQSVTNKSPAATTNLDPNSDDAQAHWDHFEREDAKKARQSPAW